MEKLKLKPEMMSRVKYRKVGSSCDGNIYDIMLDGRIIGTVGKTGDAVRTFWTCDPAEDVEVFKNSQRSRRWGSNWNDARNCEMTRDSATYARLFGNY
ncbi:MAG TPA: hypothetical protein PKM65_20450 [Spirochaetota bacterium]|nr:hypothetical protein [Spirochaetota bacterium]